MTRHVVNFSAGAGSWAAAKRVAERHGTADLTLLFTDTLSEDEDTYRFLLEGAADVLGVELPSQFVPRVEDFPPFQERDAYKLFLSGLRLEAQHLIPGLVWLVEGRDIWDVFFGKRFLGNSSFDPCSYELKRKMADAWYERNCDPADTICYVGIDFTESQRFDDGKGKGVRPRRAKEGWTFEAPMMDAPWLLKDDVLRWMRSCGIRPPRLYDKGFAHGNCFSGETRFHTRDGLVRLVDKVDREVEVPTSRGGWSKATVRSFGPQRLYRLHLERMGCKLTHDCTIDHRWFVWEGNRCDTKLERTTGALRPGDRLVMGRFGALPENIKLSPQGIAHGIVFGDGNANDVEKSGFVNPSRILLCGEKAIDLSGWFPLNDQKVVPGKGIEVRDLPRFMKKRPPIEESRSYLAGWIAGYIATDGSVSENGDVTITSADRSNLETVEDVCAKIGIFTSPIGAITGSTQFKENRTLFSIALARSSLRQDMFLRQKHARRIANASALRPKRIPSWKVTQVEDLGVEQEVYCAVVPETEAFVIEGGILTGNCRGFCVKAGHGQFKHLLEVDRPFYLFNERREREIQEILGEHNTILTDRSGDGKKKPLSLARFRERIEGDRQHGLELDDFGGCGCFLDAAE